MSHYPDEQPFREPAPDPATPQAPVHPSAWYRPMSSDEEVAAAATHPIAYAAPAPESAPASVLESSHAAYGVSPTQPMPTWGPPPAPAGAGWPPPSAPSPAPVGPSAATAPVRRGGVLAAAAGLGLVAGLLGGGVGGWAVANATKGTTVASPLPAPNPGVTARPDGSIAKIAATALPSVVTIKTKSSQGSGTGSGFVIDRSGHVLTNNHVVASVADGGNLAVELGDGTRLPATIVGRDVSYDLAVLKIDRTDLVPLEWGKSSDVVVGDGVIAVGAPLGLEASVTSGIVSALNRPVAAGRSSSEASYINAIQTDAAINPGNSGGPLLDMSGRVIGVNSAIARDPGSAGEVSGNIGVGFAIPRDQAAKTAQQLIATGKAEHPIMGVRLDSSFEGIGARIRDSDGITPGSSADKAGLKNGDVVVAFEGRRVIDANQLIVAIRSRTVGETVKLTVDRDGQRVDVSLTLQSSAAS